MIKHDPYGFLSQNLAFRIVDFFDLSMKNLTSCVINNQCPQWKAISLLRANFDSVFLAKPELVPLGFIKKA